MSKKLNGVAGKHPDGEKGVFPARLRRFFLLVVFHRFSLFDLTGRTRRCLPGMFETVRVLGQGYFLR